MGVVELDRRLVGQRADVAELLQMPAHQILQRGGGEEEFLAQAQFLARRRRVRRDRARARCSRRACARRAPRHGRPWLKASSWIGSRARAPPQPQGVHFLAAPPEDRRVVGDGEHGFAGHPFVARRPVPAFAHGHGAAEADLVIGFAPLEFPRIAEGEPILGRLDLPAIRDGLAEQAEIVADAVAERRDADRRHALHETGGEAAQGRHCRARRRARVREIASRSTASSFERGPHRLRQAEIAQRLIEQAADQEFERKVVDALAAGPIRPRASRPSSCR